MSRYFVCCEKCFESIASVNTRAAKMWLDICGTYLMRGNYFNVPNKESAELDLLEKMGFIISNERDNFIVIKVLGHMAGWDTTKDYFCIEHINHE